MGPPSRKQKKKAQEPAFNETALAQLTSKIDKSLSKVAEKQDSPGRKRKHAPEDERKSKRRQTGTEPQNQPSTPAHKKSRDSSSSALLEEILALGGDEADLELVANIDSDDEGGNAPDSELSRNVQIDKSFQEELAKFASSLGFESLPQEDDVTADEEEEEDEEEETALEEGSRDDELEASEGMSVPLQDPMQEVRNGRQSGKLVSFFKTKEPFAGLV